jgi:hypothetical protein
MNRWPWITPLFSAVLGLSPYGQDLVHGAFFSGEQLARSLNQLLLYIFAGIMLAAVALEWLLRWLLLKRRRP